MTGQISRAQLAQFLPDPQLIRAFENILSSVDSTLPAATAAAQVTANAALELSTAKTLGVFDHKPVRLNLTPGDGLQVVATVDGYAVSVDLAYLVNAIRAFIPRPIQPAPTNDTQAVLSARIFRR